jgi:Pregnancy-associated plasma protein-A/Secretion system C-terminal sorting domain
MNSHRFVITAFALCICFSIAAQKTNRKLPEKCGTMQRLEQRFQQNAVLRTRFEQKRIQFSRTLSTRGLNKTAKLNATIYIPVVFHVVMPDPNLVTDAQVQAQLDTLNRDFFGANGDSVKIPSYFKSLFGKSGIQFCLAQRTPDGESTTGIDRIITSKNDFSFDDGVKHSYSGGTDSWNTDKYLNVWICTLSDGLLGYGTFPDDGSPAEQGIVIDYRSLPGGPFIGFNGGKTLTHETGHYFNLYHIWGDDNGACTGSDDVDDTPNQADATSGCLSGIINDNCTPAGNGIMYQNYMDYSDDPCLVMFTTDQADRMEAALSMYRPSLLSSNGCQPVILSNYDVQLRSVNQPFQRICSSGFTPQVTIKNRGIQNLTSVQISTKIDNGAVTDYQWTGSLTTYNTITINLNNLTTTPGNHTLTVYVSNPNSNTDQDRSNDTIQINFQYFAPVAQISESFEGTAFPPPGWDVVNPDNGLTWQRVSGIGKTGNASVQMNNYDYDRIGEKDDLRLPSVNLSNSIDSAFLSFQVAAATYTDVTTPNNYWDTLEVLISTNCGQSYTSVYKKWGKKLVTDTVSTISPFYPRSSEWRKDSINLSGFIGNSELLITFRNTTGFENNIYLDDINFRTVTINPNLKAQGFIVTPNPTSGAIEVQFFPQPSNLRAIQLFNELGQKITEVNIASGRANNYYNFDLSRYAKGMYTVRAIFTDRVLTKKIIRL